MFITDSTSRRDSAQSYRTETLERDLRRAIARRDTDAVRAIGRRCSNTHDMRELLWRVFDNDWHVVSFVGNAWESINGWYR